MPLSYVAELGFAEDARTAGARAAGFALERHYAVLREGGWRPIADESLQEGDWLRVTLELTTAAPRAFVALTDEVPGSLRPTDLALSAVAANSMQDVAD